ncbi:MAG: hypothetical protein RIQ79_171 [Verrucomicrobiota bacterium]
MRLCSPCLREKPRGGSLLVFVALASFATAAPLAITWQGGAQGEWQIPGNWSPDVIPGGLDGDEHSATVSFAAVALEENVQLGSLTVNGTTLSGAHMLKCVGPEGLMLYGENLFSADLGVVVTQRFAFVNAESALTNHGTLQIGASGHLLEIGATPGSAVGTLTNAFDGIVRFNPNTVIELGGAFGTLVEPITVGASDPFEFINLGTILVDEFRQVDIHTALVQLSPARLVVKASSSISLWAGGAISGNIEVDATAQVRLVGVTGAYSEPLVSYTLDQTHVSGAGGVQADRVILAGSLASGTLRAENCELTEAFNNHGQLTLRYTHIRGGFVNHPGALLRWLYGTTLAIPSRLTNRGTLQFDRTSSFGDSLSLAGYSATIENTSGGVLRFDPAGFCIVGSYIGKPPLEIENAGTLLSDNPTPASFPNSIYIPLKNTGLIRVAVGSALFITPASFSQTAGETRVEDAELSGGSTIPLTFAGGVLRATGKLNGPVTLGPEAALEIGLAQAAGTLRFTSSLTLSPGAQVHFDLVSTQDGGNDRMLVTDTLQLDGRLRIRLTPDLAATLTPETTFTVATAGTITGTFANIHAGRVWTTDGSGSFQVSQTAASVNLVDYRPAPAFEAWQHRYWPDAADPTVDGRPDADPDADGIVNLLEFALGGNPMGPGGTGIPACVQNAGDLTLTYVRAQPASVTYLVETTTDLTTPASWTATGVTQGTPDVNGLTTATIPYATGPRFLRLSVTPTP